MNELSLPIIDNTVHKTRLWLDDIMAEMGWTNRAVAFRGLRSVLHALRDELTVAETADLAAELPLLLRGVYYEGWKPSTCQRPGRTLTEFLSKVAEEFGDRPSSDIENLSLAVFHAMERHISSGEIRDVLQCLSTELQEFLEGLRVRRVGETLLRSGV